MILDFTLAISWWLTENSIVIDDDEDDDLIAWSNHISSQIIVNNPEMEDKNTNGNADDIVHICENMADSDPDDIVML